MLKQTTLQKIALVALLFILPACIRQAPPTLPPVQDVAPIAEETDAPPTRMPATSTPVPIEVLPTSTSLPGVIITAIKGNLFIRRGPDMAYNPVGVLYKGTSAKAIAQDVLSDWVQIIIPGSQNTGWVSIQTRYSKVDGDMRSLPGFTQTEWPIPAYLRNCTAHEMYILPGEITLPSYLDAPENETWLYPGIYTVYDLEVVDYPEVLNVEIREGLEIEIEIDGLSAKRKCP
jgi:hypothetical protein